MDDHEAMGLALDEARAAANEGEVPVGAVIVVDGSPIAARHNERERLEDPTGHAEVLALRDAARQSGSWRLDRATLYVTLEPCPMCAGAAVAARLARVVFGAADPVAGAAGSLYNIVDDERLNHSCAIVHGVRATEASELLQQFFASRRSTG